ncbi:MAG: hypothetical protein ABEJ87_05830 [Candidatus Nanohalobium sp.]
MRISSSSEGLGCQSVYRVLGVFDADINFYLDSFNVDREDFDFEGVLTGSGALAVHADRHDIEYDTDTKDIDIYTNQELSDLENMETFPHTEMSRENGSQYCYDTTSASTTANAPGAFVDVITDYNQAFGVEEDTATEVEELLEEQASGEPIIDGAVTVYLPDLETLKRTYQFQDLDHEDRVAMIEDMKELEDA